MNYMIINYIYKLSFCIEVLILSKLNNTFNSCYYYYYYYIRGVNIRLIIKAEFTNHKFSGKNKKQMEK